MEPVIPLAGLQPIYSVADVERAAADSTARSNEGLKGWYERMRTLGGSRFIVKPSTKSAVDDLYEMKDYAPAVASAQRVIDTYPGADAGIRRSAWIVVAHGSFELADYPRAENAYTQVLAVTPFPLMSPTEMRRNRVNDGRPLMTYFTPPGPSVWYRIGSTFGKPGRSLRFDMSVSASVTALQAIAWGREDGGSGARYS